MSRTVSMTAIAVCMAAAALAAQSREKGTAVTVTGCVEPSTENMINSQTSPSYKLTHVMPRDADRSSAAKTLGYSLEGSDADLRTHVGHTVEVIGVIVPKDSATVTGTTPTPVATAGEIKTVDNGAPRLTVSAVKMIASTCEKK